MKPWMHFVWPSLAIGAMMITTMFVARWRGWALLLGPMLGVALMFATPAIAQAPKALSVQQALDLYTGLSALDVYEDTDKDGKPIRRPYKFSGSTRLAIARHLETTAAIVRAFQMAQTALVSQMSDGGKEVPPERMAAYLKELDKMTSGSAGITLSPITEEDLDLASNPIPASVLSRILPIVAKK